MADLQPWKPSDHTGLSRADIQTILQRVAEGDLLRDIAKDYGVSRSAVSHYIAAHVPKEQWQTVREHSIAARLELAQEELAHAPDQLTLARAREIAGLWKWRAEREFGHIYQTKPLTAVSVAGSGEMTVQIVSYADNTAEHNDSIIDDKSVPDPESA